MRKMEQGRYLTPEEFEAEWSTPLTFESKFDPTVSPLDSQESGDDEVVDEKASEDPADSE